MKYYITEYQVDQMLDLVAANRKLRECMSTKGYKAIENITKREEEYKIKLEEIKKFG